MQIRIGLGLAALGRPGYINLGHAEDLLHSYDVGVMQAHAHTVLDAAYTAGVRYLDVARSYGRAEEFLRSWLDARGLPPGAITVGSKWGYIYTAGWQTSAEHHEIKDHSLANFERQLGESLALLGPYLRLYQIHSATRESGALENQPVLSALARLRASGITVGLSVSGPGQVETILRALEVRVDGVRLFESVQATWNLLEPSAGPTLAQAHAAGVHVIVKEALANGRLTDRNRDPAFAAAAAVLAMQAARLETTIDALALAGALAQPWASTVLSGAATVAQLHANLAAHQVRWDDEAASATATLAEPPATYWERRSRLPWN